MLLVMWMVWETETSTVMSYLQTAWELPISGRNPRLQSRPANKVMGVLFAPQSFGLRLHLLVSLPIEGLRCLVCQCVIWCHFNYGFCFCCETKFMFSCRSQVKLNAVMLCLFHTIWKKNNNPILLFGTEFLTTRGKIGLLQGGIQTPVVFCCSVFIGSCGSCV